MEALHAFMQDESEHKHYLIISAVANLFVNLLGVWFFRGYARVHIGNFHYDGDMAYQRRESWFIGNFLYDDVMAY